MLEKRRLGTSGVIDARRKQIVGSRLPISGGIESNFNLPSGALSSGIATNRLDDALEGTLSEQRMGLDKERVNVAYNRALQRAQDANLDRRSSEDFARQIMNDEIRRQQESTMNEKARQQKIRQQGIASDAMARGEALQQFPDPQAEYQSAMVRILSGLPIQLLTYYGLSGGFGKDTTQPDTRVNTFNPTVSKPELNPLDKFRR